MSNSTSRPDREFAAAVDAAGLAPDDSFRAPLRTELEAIAGGDVAVL
jgi:hypothetical protein